MTKLDTHRKATLADIAGLRELMTLSIKKTIGAMLSPAQVEASFELMGVDTNLITDGTYYVVESNQQIIGCGGWSRRATLFGGDHTIGRDARLLDPATEPARIRAMYVHPEHGRKGVGSFIMALCEAEAKREGFCQFELMSTVSGEALYLARGYAVVERVEIPTTTGIAVPLIRMSKHHA